MLDFAKGARQSGIQVIIAGAGGAAHLPGMVASATTLPVIGVPVKSSNSIEGIDSLLSIVQMPKGIPVATMAINGAYNAGLMAVRILATGDENLSLKLQEYELSLQEKVKKMNEGL
jgi:5-(carboxyamino)imidazole ribonucleotide mutase